MKLKRFLSVLAAVMMLVSLVQPAFATLFDGAARPSDKYCQHRFGPWVEIEPANCLHPAKVQHTCSICGYSEWQWQGEKGPHKWGEWYVAQEATSEQPGIRRRECSVCGLQEEEYFYVEGAGEAPTISLLVWADPGPYTLGDHVAVTLTLTDTCEEALTYVDQMTETSQAYPDSIDPGASYTVMDYLDITAADINAAMLNGGKLLLTYGVRYQNADGLTAYAVTEAEISINIPPTDLGLVLSVTVPGGLAEPYAEDDKVLFNAVLTNTSTVTLENVTFYGPMDSKNGWTLAPGESCSCAFEYVVTYDDCVSGAVELSFDGSGHQKDATDADEPVWSNTVIIDFTTVVPDHDPYLTLAGYGSPGGDVVLGSVIPITLVATNAGSDEVEMLTLNLAPYPNTEGDHKDGWASVADYHVPVGDSVSFGYGITVGNEDISTGKVVRQFSVNYRWISEDGTELNFVTNTVDVSFDITLGELHPELTLSCVSGAGAGKVVGDTVSGTVTLTNTGNVPVSFSHITVDAYAGCTNAGAYDSFNVWDPYIGTVLEPGESISVTMSTAIVLEDGLAVIRRYQAAGFYTRKEGGFGGVYSNKATLNVPLTMENEPIEVSKYVTSMPLDIAGYALNETIKYSVVIKNVRATEVTNVRLYDPLVGLPGVPIQTYSAIAPGESVTFNYSYVVKPENVNDHYVTNEAEVDYADEESENNVVYSNPVTVPVIGDTTPHVTLVKSVIGGPLNGEYYVPNETITFNVHIKNDSDFGVYYGNLYDGLIQPESVRYFEELAPGEELDVILTYVVSEYDIPSVSNTAYFSGRSAGSKYEDVTATSNTVTVEVGNPEYHPGLSITKTASKPKNGSWFVEDEVVHFTITVTNTGDTPLDIELFDALADSSFIGAAHLEPGKSFVKDFYYTVTHYDAVYYMWLSNYAWVTSTMPDGTVGPWADVFCNVDCGEGDPPTEEFKPMEGDSCVRTLVKRGAHDAEYTLDYCVEHNDVALRAASLINTAETPEDKLTAAQQVRALWQESLTKMNTLYAQAMPRQSAGFTMIRAAAFDRFVPAFEELLKSRGVGEYERLTAVNILLSERVADLCYELHNAPALRPDSLLNGTYTALLTHGFAQKCDEREIATLDGSRHYQLVTCAVHGVLDQVTLAQLEQAGTDPEAQAAVFGTSRSILRNVLGTLLAAKGQSKEGALYLSALDNLLTMDKKVYDVIYADQPQTVEEVLMNALRRQLTDVCSIE